MCGQGSVANKDATNCWDYWGCADSAKDDCWVYRKKLGRICWYVPGVFRTKVRERQTPCEECAWYQRVNSL